MAAQRTHNPRKSVRFRSPLFGLVGKWLSRLPVEENVTGSNPVRSAMSSLIEELKLKVDIRNQKAIRILERRGFHFLHHYGYENAADKMEAMNRAFENGYLPQFLQAEFGIPLT